MEEGRERAYPGTSGTVSLARDLMDLATHMRANDFLPTPARILYDNHQDYLLVVVLPKEASWWLATLDVQEGEPEVRDLLNGSTSVNHHCRLPLRRPDGVRVDLVYFREDITT